MSKLDELKKNRVAKGLFGAFIGVTVLMAAIIIIFAIVKLAPWSLIVATLAVVAAFGFAMGYNENDWY